MLSDPITLYKLMVLYMLKKVNFPITNSQMSEFLLDKGYTNYFTFQQVLNELLDANLIKMETVRNSSRYEITSEGEETLGFFGDKISPAVIADIDDFLKTNKFKLRNEVAVSADYYKNTNQEYIAHLVVKEGRSTLIELNLAFPSKEQADAVCDKWSEQNQKIYEFIVRKLMG